METYPRNDLTIMNDNTNAADGYEWLQKRYLLAGVLCVAIFCLFALSTNTSLAIVEMTKNRTIEINGTAVNYGPEFDWSSKVIGLVLSLSVYGHLGATFVSNLAKKFGGLRTHGCTLFLNGTINVLFPFIVRFNFYLFLFMRIIQGILESLIFLSTYEIWSKWAPKAERSKLISIQFTGSYIANAVTFPIGGYLAYIWRWPSIYYFTGGTAILVSFIILLLFSNEPSTDRFISEKERNFLTNEPGIRLQEKVTYPWKQIFTSKPLWALFALKFSYICTTTFFGLCLPLYVKDITNMGIQNVGVFSGVPNVLVIIALPIFGWLADYMQNKNLLNATQIHKSYTLLGMIPSAGIFFVIALTNGNAFTTNEILLTICQMLLSLTDAVTVFVPLFLAPNHVSLVAGIISYSYIFAVMLIPNLIGYVVTSHEAYQWSIFLTLLGVIVFAGGLTFIFFGSSEAQPWSTNQNELKDEVNRLKDANSVTPHYVIT